MHDLHKLICYKILTFLNESDNKILFIQIPVEELSNNINNQGKYWRDFCETVALAVRLSLKRRTLTCKELRYPDGDWYKDGDKFLLIPQDTREKYFYLTVKDKKVKFEWQNKPGRNDFAGKINEKQNIISNAKAIYILENLPSQKNKGFDTCLNEIDLLNSFPEGKYYSGVLVGSSLGSKKSRNSGVYISPIVNIHNSRDNIIKSDVTAIVGDNNFDKMQSIINSLAPRGPRMKLIVIGSSPNDYLINQNPSPEIFILKFNQIYRYCTCDKHYKYKDPEIVSIEFPWLKQTLSRLKDILESSDAKIGLDTKKRIYNYSRMIFSSIFFSNSSLEMFKEYFMELLDDESLGIADDNIISKLEAWKDSLNYPDQTNPKHKYAKKIKASIINDKKSIPKQIKKLKGKICVLDAPRHNPQICAMNNITTAMRYRLFTEVKALFYDEVESNLKKSTEKALAEDALFSTSETIASENEKKGMNKVSIEDYIDNDEYGEYLMERIYRQEESVTFIDNSEAQISGDVLVVEDPGVYTKRKIKDVIDNSNTEIIYYTSLDGADEFNRLLNVHTRLPEGKNVKYYSDLWQNALRTLCKKFDYSEKKEFCVEVGISESVLNNHLNNRSQFLHSRSLRRVLHRLIEDKLITEEDAKFVSAARIFMRGNNIKFGQQLKDALLQFKMTNEINEFLNPLLKESKLSIQKLEQTFLKSNIIK